MDASIQFAILIVLILVALWYFDIFDVTQLFIGPQGIQGPPGVGIQGPPGDVNLLKSGILWCENYCKPPANKKKFEIGKHRLHFDDDNIMRHVGLDNTHKSIGFATGNTWVEGNASVSGVLRIGRHTLQSVGNELRIYTDGGKHVAFYSDTRHSSMKTQRINNTDNWFGYKVLYKQIQLMIITFFIKKLFFDKLIESYKVIRALKEISATGHLAHQKRTSYPKSYRG